MAKSGPAVLKIYNMIGQEVATLLDEDLQAGAYRLTFDAADLPSGLYLYRLRTNGLDESRKMVLLK